MCPVSWVRNAEGYHLLCNRDEKRTRSAATGPRVDERGGVRLIAPADGDFGGTWIAVNEFGLSLCLLNGAGGGQREGRSRGMLVRELIGATSGGECGWWLRRRDLAAFAPFTLAMLEPGQAAALARWDGERLAMVMPADSMMPLISSSYDPAGVRLCRLQEFRRRVGAKRNVDPAALYWFHASHRERPDAYSLCMHREDAETVSFSCVVVTRGEIRFFYSPAPPCRTAPGEQQVLARAA